jgi:hypothetical protein
LFGLFNFAITAHRALRQYVSPDLPVAKATAMSPSVSASGDRVAIFIFRVPCRHVLDEPANSTATNIAYAAVVQSLVHDGRCVASRFSAFQTISFSPARPTRLT